MESQGQVPVLVSRPQGPGQSDPTRDLYTRTVLRLRIPKKPSRYCGRVCQCDLHNFAPANPRLPMTCSRPQS
jgi:hypothetical protein